MFRRDRICAVVAAPTAGEMARLVRRALRETRTIELRLDWLRQRHEIVQFVAWLAEHRPRANFIATCRRREAGGRFAGNVAAQQLCLLLAAGAGCRACDVEWESLAACPERFWPFFWGNATPIVSAHFFGRAPKDLAAVVRRLARSPARYVKVAAECRTIRESLRVLELARRGRRAGGRRTVIAVPMGEAALAARVLAVRAGSALAYAAAGAPSAPGQPSLGELKNLYRADRLDRRTRVYGVIGNPIAHSLSPQLHNAGFQARGINAVYLPFLARDLRDFLAAIRPLGVCGFSVTLPHKRAMLAHLDDCDALARAIGAVNTVVVRGGGRLYGYNTDYVGVLHALERRVRLKGSRALILGAGGAARVVAFALAQAGAVVGICARREERARRLARAVGGQVIPRRQLRAEFFDAIVNATPVGMHPRTARSPLAAHELNCRLVFDLVYRPEKTRLLELAERRNIETVSGVEMFLAQGIAQWEIWTGERAPVAAMRRAVFRALRGPAAAGESGQDGRANDRGTLRP
jgi:3-dehydroquinate dehydratase/shikimate dehydrogenase